MGDKAQGKKYWLGSYVGAIEKHETAALDGC